jgi:hypothetical protein
MVDGPNFFGAAPVLGESQTTKPTTTAAATANTMGEFFGVSILIQFLSFSGTAPGSFTYFIYRYAGGGAEVCGRSVFSRMD